MEKDNMLTVIIVVHNDLPELKACIRSIRNFSGLEEIQMVVIDNASTDGTGDWLKEQGDIAYAAVEGEVEGFSSVFNTALKIFPIDGDILIMRAQYVIAPYCIARLREGLYSCEEMGAVGPVINEEISYPMYREFENYEKAIELAQRKTDGITVRQVLALPLGMVMIKAEIWKTLGGFEERLVFDTAMMMDYCINLIMKGYKIGYVEEAIAYCTVHNKKVDGYEQLLAGTDERKVLKEKWGMNYFNLVPNMYLVNKIQKPSIEPVRVLEVGCDCGATLLEIKNNYPNAELYGYELNECAAKIAGKIASVEVGNIEKEELDHEKEYFDYIILGDVLEHLHDPENTLRYLYGYLKEEGCIIASIPNLMHISVIKELLAGNFTYTDTGLLDRTHIHLFTYNEIQKMFTRIGYRMKEMDPVIAINEEDEEYMVKLLAVEPRAQQVWYEAYQYVVKAERPAGSEKSLDREKRGLEKEYHTGSSVCRCRICGEKNDNKTYSVKEMMYGTKQEFTYFACSSCKCLQIKEMPDDPGKYYADDYYSFADRKETEFDGAATYMEEKILDVGCGSGEYLLDLARQGYGNLYGCDPYIPKDIRYGDRVYIRKCGIEQIEGRFDHIRFSDSFEHMENPLETLRSVKRLLKEDGVCQIYIPVFPNAAFDTFGTNWYQIDAPRHIFLHSKESMRYLCGRSGLKIEKVEYNSVIWQFIYSYFYEQGIPLLTCRDEIETLIRQLDVEILNCFQRATEEVNKKGYGDHACFTIVHERSSDCMEKQM